MITSEKMAYSSTKTEIKTEKIMITEMRK